MKALGKAVGALLLTMCTEHWRAYVTALREARKAAATTDGPETDAA